MLLSDDDDDYDDDKSSELGGFGRQRADEKKAATRSESRALDTREKQPALPSLEPNRGEMRVSVRVGLANCKLPYHYYYYMNNHKIMTIAQIIKKKRTEQVTT